MMSYQYAHSKAIQSDPDPTQFLQRVSVQSSSDAIASTPPLPECAFHRDFSRVSLYRDVPDSVLQLARQQATTQATMRVQIQSKTGKNGKGEGLELGQAIHAPENTGVTTADILGALNGLLPRVPKDIAEEVYATAGEVIAAVRGMVTSKGVKGSNLSTSWYVSNSAGYKSLRIDVENIRGVNLKS